MLGAYHDGYIELVYPDVNSYDLAGMHVGRGHGDLQIEAGVADQIIGTAARFRVMDPPGFG
jgi:hypothetical protein